MVWLWRRLFKRLEREIGLAKRRLVAIYPFEKLERSSRREASRTQEYIVLSAVLSRYVKAARYMYLFTIYL
jgi:hypothetical protein